MAWPRLGAFDPDKPPPVEAADVQGACINAITQISEKDAKLAQKSGQLQPLIAVFPQACMGQLAYFGST